MLDQKFNSSIGSILNKMAAERVGEIRGQFYLLAGVRGAGEGQCLLWRPAVGELEQPLHHTVQQQGEIVITPEVKSPPTSHYLRFSKTTTVKR